MARIRQIKNIDNRQQRLASKKKFRNKLNLQRILRYAELALLVAITIKVFTK